MTKKKRNATYDEEKTLDKSTRPWKWRVIAKKVERITTFYK